MDDDQESWDTSWHGVDDSAAGDSETGQGFPTLPQPGSVPTPDVESRMMEEDTLPRCKDVYPGHRMTLCGSNGLTGVEQVGDVRCSDNDSEIDYFPFDNAGQWKLAKALLFPKRQSRTGVTNLAVERNCPWILPGTGFKSPNDFYKRLEKLNFRGGQWQQSYVMPGPTAPAWRPNQVEFYHRDTFETLKYIVGNSRLQNHMKWAPEKHFNSKGERVFSELWTGDWWWRMQVYFSPAIHPLRTGNNRLSTCSDCGRLQPLYASGVSNNHSSYSHFGQDSLGILRQSKRLATATQYWKYCK